MIRKLLLPALLVGLLGGCVTGYGYRDGYYYGQPSVEYRYRDYGYPYGYYPYGYGYYPYSGYYFNYYSSPYYYRYPYYYNPYYYRHHHHRKPPVTGNPGPGPGDDDDDRDDHRRPPWRDLDRRRFDGTAGEPLRPRTVVPSQPQPQVRPAPRRETRADGSRMRQVIQRSKETRRRSSADTQEP